MSKSPNETAPLIPSLRPSCQSGMNVAFRVIACLAAFSIPADAQFFSAERLSDWKFRFYACKNVVMNAAILIRLMDSNQVTDQSGLETMQVAVGPGFAEAVVKNEKSFNFSDTEAAFVSDLTFAVVSGMIAGGYRLADTQLMQTGNDLCVEAIDSMEQ